MRLCLSQGGRCAIATQVLSHKCPDHRQRELAVEGSFKALLDSVAKLVRDTGRKLECQNTAPPAKTPVPDHHKLWLQVYSGDVAAHPELLVLGPDKAAAKLHVAAAPWWDSARKHL